MKSPKTQNFTVTLSFKQTRKKYCLSKVIQKFNLLWSGIVSLTRCCLQFFPTLHSFPVFYVESYKIANFRFICITFDIYFLFKNILSQMYINVRSFLQNPKSWRSIALIRENGILPKNQCIPTWYKAMFLRNVFFFHKIRRESSFSACIWLDWTKIHLRSLSFT